MPRHSAPFTTTAWALGPNEPRTHCAPSTTRSRKPRQLRPTLAWRHDSTPPAWAGLSKGTAPLRKGRSRVFHQGVDSTPAPSNAARLPHCAGMERGDRAALGSFLHGYRSPKLPLRCSARAHNLAIRHSVRPRLISPVHLFWQERCIWSAKNRNRTRRSACATTR